MYNFFIDEKNINCDKCIINGADYNHIKNVLRMRVGENLLVSCNNESHLCEITNFENDAVICNITQKNYQNTNLPVNIYLFQGLPKSDKMEFIIQKSVELGVFEIIPVEMKYSIVKIDKKKETSKITRWQAISESASKQSKRNFIPIVSNILTFSEALNMAKNLDLLLVPYENKNGMIATKDALSLIKSGMNVGIMIGPEGGFDVNEIEKVMSVDGKIISLGKRILRTETAALTGLSMLMLYAEMNLT